MSKSPKVSGVYPRPWLTTDQQKVLIPVGLAGVIIVLGFLVCLNWLEDEEMLLLLSDLLHPVIGLLASLALAYAAWKLRFYSKRLSQAWFLMAMAYLFSALGEALWAYLELVLGQETFPSLADVFYLLFYPLFIVGLLMLPRLWPAPAERLRLIVEIGIVGLSSIVVYWNLFLGQAVKNLSAENTLEFILELAYPVMDLLLVWTIFDLLLRRTARSMRWPLSLLVLSGLLFVLSDSLYSYLVLTGQYISGNPIDAGWITAYVLAALAGLAQASQNIPEEEPGWLGAKPVLWWLYLVYLWPAAAFLLFFWSDRQVLPMSHSSLVVVVGLIIALVMARQVLALQENFALYDRLQEELSGHTQALRALGESEARLKQFMETIPDAVLVVDAQGYLAYANSAARRLIPKGVPSDSFIEHLYEVFLLYRLGTDHLYPIEHLPLARALAGESSVVDDVEVLTPAGRIPLEIRAGPIWGADGCLQFALAVFHDISSRVEMERTLSVQRDLFEKLVRVARATAISPSLEATVHGALEISLETTAAEKVSLFLVDEQGTRMYSLSESGELFCERQGVVPEVMKRGLVGWVYDHQQPALLPDTLLDERWLVLSDESRSFRSALVVPISCGEQRLGVLSVFHSRTERFSPQHLEFMSAAADQIALALRNAGLYEQQRALAEELVQAQKAAEAASRAKTLFLARTSHELRTPLAIILGYTEILQEELRRAGYEALSPRLEKIQSASQHLLDLINDVLDYARLDTGRLDLNVDVFSIADLIRELSTSVRFWVDKNQNSLLIDCPPDIGMMGADLKRVRQLLYNLLHNACKFTTRGTIRLSVQAEAEDWVQFTVADTGIGMSEEQLGRLFRAFEQADPTSTGEYSGIGLGLAISNRLAKKMRGQISVMSRVGEGSTFTVRLPRYQPSES